MKTPVFTEQEVLQFLKTQSEKGEAVRLKYLHLLLPKAIPYLQRISHLDRKDEKYHLKILKDQFEELIEAMTQFNLIRTQEEQKLKYLVATDLGSAHLENPDSSIIIKSLGTPYTTKRASPPAQTAPKPLKSKEWAATIAIPSGLFLFITYSVLFATFFEANYSLPVWLLLTHYPWLAFYVFGFSAFFALVSATIIRQIVKAYGKKRSNKKLGVK